MKEKKDKGFAKYKRITVGRGGILFLFAYELITTLFGFIPGLLGYGFRRLFYGLLLHKKTKKPLIGVNVTLRCPQKILLEDDVYIEGHVSLLASPGDDKDHTIKLGKGSYVRSYSILNSGHPNGFIEIGEDSAIGHGVQIHGLGGVTIGNNVLIAGQSFIVALSHKYDDTDKYISEQGFSAKGITIEDDVWIGANVKVIDGVTIKKGSIIGAGSFVNKDIDEYCIAAGSPCRVIRKRK
jgi:acetyltransferase-like isoleucine patch superfamily enzyme